MDLLTRSREAPTRPASSSWVMGSWNSICVPGQLEQPLGRPAGHVEEHGVGQSLVGGPEALGQEPHHVPQQFRLVVEGRPARATYGMPQERPTRSRARADAERTPSSNSAISPKRSPAP